MNVNYLTLDILRDQFPRCTVALSHAWSDFARIRHEDGVELRRAWSVRELTATLLVSDSETGHEPDDNTQGLTLDLLDSNGALIGSYETNAVNGLGTLEEISADVASGDRLAQAFERAAID